jgi:hypothetical protein
VYCDFTGRLVLEVVAMILRGAAIHHDGHGRYGLLSPQPLSSKRANVPAAGVPIPIGVSLCDRMDAPHRSTEGGVACSNRENRKIFIQAEQVVG